MDGWKDGHGRMFGAQKTYTHRKAQRREREGEKGTKREGTETGLGLSRI